MIETKEVTCPRCGKEIPNKVVYRCVRCFKTYCMACDESKEGKNCPNCGMSARMVLDQETSS